jgi:hypothetical protein
MTLSVWQLVDAAGKLCRSLITNDGIKRAAAHTSVNQLVAILSRGPRRMAPLCSKHAVGDEDFRKR